MNWLYLAGFLVAIQLYIVMVGTTMKGTWWLRRWDRPAFGVDESLLSDSSWSPKDVQNQHNTPKKKTVKKLISIGMELQD